MGTRCRTTRSGSAVPFVSEAQRRFMYANHPGIARRWEDRYGTPKRLPYHKRKRAVHRAVVPRTMRGK